MDETTGPGIEARGNRLRPAIWGGATLLLLLPAVAMRFHAGGVDWSAMDFAVFGAMLAAACGLYELAARKDGDIRYRAAAGIAVATGFLTAWANLAVGMVGSEGNPFNLLFAGVLVVAGVGAVLAKLRAAGMARAMLAAAFAQALVAAAAFAIGADARGAVFSALFVAPWLLSSALFRHASQ
ncbi:MAG: hypothetical protein QM719_05640 [Thermomonas sp.]